MAVVNQYKFKGIDNDTTGNALNVFPTGIPRVNETIIIKSIIVTSAHNNATVIVINNGITAIKSSPVVANVSMELLTQPLIVEGGSSFTIQASTTDSFDYAISYLNIKKERVD